MKIFKKLMIAVLCLTVLISTYDMFKLETKAAAKKTYYIRYVSTDFYACDVPWEIGAPVVTFPANTLDFYMNDGDNVVIYTGGFNFEQGFNKKIGELTISDNGYANILAPAGIDKVHILTGVRAEIKGNVPDAYVYDSGTCTFHNDVNTLHLVEVVKKDQTVNVFGTVGCVEESKVGYSETNCYYNFSEGECKYVGGGLQSKAGTYSKDPGAYMPTVPTVPSVPGNGGNDLDDVPKTGELNLGMSILLLALSAFCTVGACVLYRKRA